MSRKKKDTSSAVEFTLAEAKQEIQEFIEINRKNHKKGITKKLAINLEGEAGIGKTSMPEQLAEEMGISFSQLNLAQIDELADLVGYPIVKYPIVRENEDKSISQEYVSERNLDIYISRGWKIADKPPMMSYAAPEWIVNKGESGILLLDDFTRANPRFQQAVMELINKGRYISWDLPEDWHIVLSSNPDSGDYHVESLDVAQTTRYFTCRVKYDRYVWAEYAEKLGLDGRCINFLLMYPEAVYHDGKSLANPRQWTDFFLSIGSSSDFESDFGKVSKRGEMSVGGQATALFLTFINNKLDKLLLPEDMFSMGEKMVLEKFKECIGNGKTYRADIASVLGTRLINYSLNWAANNPVTDEMIDRLEAILLSGSCGSDITFQIIKKLTPNRKFGKLINRPKIFKMLTQES